MTIPKKQNRIEQSYSLVLEFNIEIISFKFLKITNVKINVGNDFNNFFLIGRLKKINKL